MHVWCRGECRTLGFQALFAGLGARANGGPERCRATAPNEEGPSGPPYSEAEAETAFA
jgi:hypothetical protein